MDAALLRRARRPCALLLIVIGVLGAVLLPADSARADGDPGSDVLVNQTIFLPSDAGASVGTETQLGGLLGAAGDAGLHLRLAVIAHPDDLGAVTALWRRPRTYAQFLATELSLAFTGPLLVAMPGGFGFWWPGHPSATAHAQHELAQIVVRGGTPGLLTATREAVRRLSAAGLPRLPEPSAGPIGDPTRSASAAGTPGGPKILSGSAGPTSTRVAAAILVLVAAALAAAWLVARSGVLRVTRGDGPSDGVRRRRRVWFLPGAALAAATAGLVLLLAGVHPSAPETIGRLADNPSLDPGTSLSSEAPNFVLFDQFGRRVTLRQYRGKVVLLAFIDSECTTICPLTTTAMLDAERLLGRAGRDVALLGVDADPKQVQVQDVLSYSELHGMTHAWRFATGTVAQLDPIWRAYHVEAAIRGGLIAHTPALFVIDPQGRERRLYVTQQAYSAVPQLGQLLAEESSRLLPGHPTVSEHASLGAVPTVSPSVSAELPKVGGGAVRIGPGADRLLVFFDTWDRQVMPIGGRLDELDAYARTASRLGLPALVAIDEASVEPSASALPRFLVGLRSPLAFPVGVDNTGQVADGYDVQGEPWLVLTSAAGRILWYQQPDTAGWPTVGQLRREVRDALRGEPSTAATPSTAARELRGAPAVLQALHAQAGRLLGGEDALLARIRALRGYPVVVNIWASWCGPCRSEFNLFAAASAAYGKAVAFLGVDDDDSTADAAAFLRAHPVSYPSYRVSDGELTGLLPGGIQGTPTTLYIDPAGHIVSIHAGQYDAPGALDGDIDQYASGSRRATPAGPGGPMNGTK